MYTRWTRWTLIYPETALITCAYTSKLMFIIIKFDDFLIEYFLERFFLNFLPELVLVGRNPQTFWTRSFLRCKVLNFR